MPDAYRIAYIAHALRSDWNNGNAHFLRGLLNALTLEGNDVVGFELEENWSLTNLRQEPEATRALADFERTYPRLKIQTFPEDAELEWWRERLHGFDAVIFHEWNSAEVAWTLQRLRKQAGFTLLFHDTHHRVTSSPASLELLGLAHFDGVLAFGEALRTIYRERYGLPHVWTLHEAADIKIFKPHDGVPKTTDLVWIGNWGDDERSHEIEEFLLNPAAAQTPAIRATIYGVRYPAEGLHKLDRAGVRYGSYLPNLDAPQVYATSRLTVHVPRQQYAGAMHGIPTIRVFEALACGIPLLSAPWNDTEGLFRHLDFWMVENGAAMRDAMHTLLAQPARAADQAQRGRETVLARHTCTHRARELTEILKELRQ